VPFDTIKLLKYTEAAASVGLGENMKKVAYKLYVSYK